MLQTQINADSALVAAGLEVEVLYSATNNNLELRAVDGFGGNSRVDVLSTRPQVPALLGLNVGNGTAGADVAGTINGVAATGSGNLLTAAVGDASEGIVLEVGGTTTGARGNVTFDEGIWATLNRYLDGVLGADGAVTKRINGFEKSKKELEERSLKLEERWKTLEVTYRTQYNTLDRLVAQLRSTSSFLEGQLAAIAQGSG
jgi:flagellar hook-associated protein 2